MAQRLERLGQICREHDVLACYAFGSRAADAWPVLKGESVVRGSSDLDIGVVFRTPARDPRTLAALQVALEDLFAPLRVDLVPFDRVDPLFQFAAISGERLSSTDRPRTDRFELTVMRRASELLPVQRRLEREAFGRTSS